MNHFKLACGAVAIMTLAATYAIGRSPSPTVPPPPASVEAVETDDTDQNREVAYAALRKSNNLATTEPKTVAVEKIIPPIIPTVSIAKSKPVETSVDDQKKAESNICTRNKRRKVWISKYKWKCLK